MIDIYTIKQTIKNRIDAGLLTIEQIESATKNQLAAALDVPAEKISNRQAIYFRDRALRYAKKVKEEEQRKTAEAYIQLQWPKASVQIEHTPDGELYFAVYPTGYDVPEFEAVRK
jgi:hypothetical protein